MTYLTRDARKIELAQRFGRALLKARRKRGIGKRRISEQTGISRNSLTYYEQGKVLPRFTQAMRIAQALGDEDLAGVVRECRTLPCAGCGQPFINDGQVNTRYCKPSCQTYEQKKRSLRPTRLMADKSVREAGILRTAVAAMCISCEPAGACRTADCPLRIVSPLPLIGAEGDAPLVTAATGWHARPQLAGRR